MRPPNGRDDPGDALPGDAEISSFADDLQSAFPEAPMPERMAEDHVAAMMSAVESLAAENGSVFEPADRSRSAERTLLSMRRKTMHRRIIVRVAAVATGLLLSMGGLAIAGAFPGSGEDPADEPAVVVNETPEDADDADETEEADAADEVDESTEVDDADKAEDAEDADETEEADDDDQGENAEDADESEEADDDDEGEDADEADESEDEGDEASEEDGGGSDD